MAFNPFKSKPPVDKPNRNAFDLSFANNLTMEFGKLYPVFFKECLPGDTFKIKPTFGFRFMPMYFPVQSRMRADLKFFYVRNRNLWDNWKKFIGQTDRISGQEVVPPYLKITSSQAGRLTTGSLLDYLGVPTTAPTLVTGTENYSFGGYNDDFANESPNGFEITNSESTSYHATGISRMVYNKYTLNEIYNADEENDPYGMFTGGAYQLMSMLKVPMTSPLDVNSTIKFYIKDRLDIEGRSIFEQEFVGNGYLMIFSIAVGNVGVHPRAYDFEFGCSLTTVYRSGNPYFEVDGFNTGVSRDNNSGISLSDWMDGRDFTSKNYYLAFAFNYGDVTVPKYEGIDNNSGKPKMYEGIDIVFPYMVEITSNFQKTDDISLAHSPFISEDDAEPIIQLSALPSRAYESIYNAFYRNVEVDPFRINTSNPQQLPNGTEPPEYDKFIPVSTDGADAYPYNFHYQYWEHDFLTDSLPSPQMGVAPLVGGRPGNDYSQYTITSGSNQINVYVDNASKDLLSITPNSSNEDVSNVLNEAISYGISINDFRDVNALQKWLEKNVRRGYRYKDQMLSHFGVSLSYEECDMPEYIGGISEDVNVRAVSQSVGTSDAPLGALAGQASVVGTSKHEIDKYTDEHGFIIGILCITPIPTYSQLLPKHFVKRSPLDYFTPEFGHIGMQPIPLKEVAPLNVALEHSELTDERLRLEMEKTFGYQRAWYDYLGSTDEVHGQFKTTLRDYLVDRVFEGVPELSRQFLEVQPNQINDIFNYQGTDDKIVGQMWFDTTVVRPIPKYGVPRLD